MKKLEGSALTVVTCLGIDLPFESYTKSDDCKIVSSSVYKAIYLSQRNTCRRRQYC